jgi:hypothetical protein
MVLLFHSFTALDVRQKKYYSSTIVCSRKLRCKFKKKKMSEAKMNESSMKNAQALAKKQEIVRRSFFLFC